MRPIIVALLTLASLAAPAAAQDEAREARLRRTLARWTEQARRGSPDPPLTDARRLRCRTRPPSCMCGGLPMGPRPRATNRDAVTEQLAACLDGRADGNEHPVGRIEAELRITPRGRVDSVRIVTDEVGDRRLTACVRAQLLRMRYEPVRRGERVLRWPLIFAPPAREAEDGERGEASTEEHAPEPPGP